MGRPHKYAGSRLTARTALPPERVRELCAASAEVAVGTTWDGRSVTVLTESTPAGDRYEIRSGLRARFVQIQFAVAIARDGDATDVGATITWYRTTQTRWMWFIPVSPKTMLGHHVFLQFVQDLAQRLRAEDPTSSVSVFRGQECILAVAGAAEVDAAVDAAVDGVGSACGACGTTPYPEDRFCGGCGARLTATTDAEVAR